MLQELESTMTGKIKSHFNTQHLLLIYKLFLICFFSATFLNNAVLLGQNVPLELWSGVEADVQLPYDLSIRAGKELRSNLTEKYIRTDINDIGLSYRILSWWRISSYYRWKIREKANISGLYYSTNFSYSIESFDFKYRLRYDSKGLDKEQENDYIRNRVTISYNTSKILTFSVESDIFLNLNHKRFNAIRYKFNTDISTTKRQTLNLYLMKENEFNIDNPQSKLVFGISYQLKTIRFTP